MGLKTPKEKKEEIFNKPKGKTGDLAEAIKDIYDRLEEFEQK